MNNRILHLTWKNADLSEKQRFILERWILTNPQLGVKFYTDEENDKFVKTYFPEFVDILKRFDKVVMRLDLIRLLYVYKWGGIYADFDVLPLKNIDKLLDINQVVICEEDRRNSESFNTDYILSNAVIIAKPGAAFIEYLINIIVQNSESPLINSKSNTDVLSLTGPLCLNKAYESYIDKSQVTILDSNYFNPMNLDDLRVGKISPKISFSFLVHLYDGTWWQSVWNTPLDLINKMINLHDAIVINYTDKFKELLPEYSKTKIAKFPLISCLCITKNNYSLVSKSIDSFNAQVYPNKELVIVYEDNNIYINDLINNYTSDDIRFIKVNTNPKKSLGELRNLSILESKGDYICQWDDDDWYHPLRLWEQFRHSKLNKKNGSILTRWMVYDTVQNNLLTCKRLSLKGWEGSFLYKKSELKELYQPMAKGEDTGFIENIEDDLAVLDKPELYIYRIHSDNTWGYQSLYDKIIRYSLSYKGILDYDFLKSSMLETMNGTYGKVLINNNRFSLDEFSSIEKDYELGVVIPISNNSDKVELMLKTLQTSDINNKILFIFIDESSELESSEYFKDYKLNVNYIKIFKQIKSGRSNSIKTGFDILDKDFNCKNYMYLDSDVILTYDWYYQLNSDLFDVFSKKNVIALSSSDKSGGEKIINKFFLNLEFSKNLFIRKDLYKHIAHLFKYNSEEIDRLIYLHFATNKWFILSPIKPIILQSKEHYFNFRDLQYLFDEYKQRGEIPPVVHRMLLYDEDFPVNVKSYLESFKKFNNNFYQILWSEEDVLSIMNSEEIEVYTNYVHKIQKADYARYIVLKYFGGIYVDLDIEFIKDFYPIYLSHNKKDLFFEELTLSNDFVKETKNFKIRGGKEETPLRIANYIIMTLPQSDNIQGIIDLCNKRKDLIVNEDYDIIYTTGPDVVSQYMQDHKMDYFVKVGCDKYFLHKHVGHWRKKYTYKDFKISVVMQSYLSDYPGSRSNPEMKFIRAVNSFINQSNKNTELIIVADNCRITESLYNKHFKDNDRIKFIMYTKEKPVMYSNTDGKINYVGEPRQMGVDLAGGDIITYMDSDDIITKDYLMTLHKYWSVNPNLVAIINKSWYDNSKVLNGNVKYYYTVFERHYKPDLLDIEGLESKWVRSSVGKGTLHSPVLLSHKKDIKAKWSNSVGVSEDHSFYKELNNNYNGVGMAVHIFGYVRCHLKGEWDF